MGNIIVGLRNYCNDTYPYIIVVHGDRLESLTGTIGGAFNNIKVMHIGGGDVSGIIADSIR